MEWWNDGMLVFKRILAILILSSLPPVAGPLISPRRRRYPYEPEANIALSSPSGRLYEPEARTHYSTIPLFHHSNRSTLSLDSEALEGRLSTGCERSELTCHYSGFDTLFSQFHLRKSILTTTPASDIRLGIGSL